MSLAEMLIARDGQARKLRTWATLVDLVAEPGKHGVDAIVTGTIAGTIAGVSKGVGAINLTEAEIDQDGHESDVRFVGFDDPGVMWQTLVVEFRVTDVPSESALGIQVGDTIQLGLSIYPTVSCEVARDELVDLGDVVVPLQAPFAESGNAVFQEDPDVYPIIDDGTMVVVVNPDGSLSLPFKDPEEATAILAGTERLADLGAA